MPAALLPHALKACIVGLIAIYLKPWPMGLDLDHHGDELVDLFVDWLLTD